jgi:hypothetical protein
MGIVLKEKGEKQILFGDDNKGASASIRSVEGVHLTAYGV